MKYTPAQFRDSVGVPQETLRHWRKVLPIFADRNGYRPIFSIGDLVIGVVIKCLRIQMGISVSSLADMSRELDKACSQTPWALLQQSLLIIDMENRTCRLHPERMQLTGDGLQVIVPLAPILQQITDALMRTGDDAQHQIPFPPSAVSAAVGRKAKKA